MNIDPAKTKLSVEYKHEAPLLSCAFDGSGRFLFAGGRDRGVVLIDILSKQKSTLAGHESWVNRMGRAGRDLVLTADFVGHVIAWDCTESIPKPRWNIEAHPSTIYALSVSADGKTFATGDRDGCVRIWQASDGKRLHELPRIEYPVYGVALHPNGRHLITADRQPVKPRIKVWDIGTNQAILTIEIAELSGYRRVEDIEWGGIRDVAVSANGHEIIACGRAGYDGQACALVYGSEDGKLLRKLSVALKGGFYYGAKFHSQGFLMTAGGDIGKGEVRIWNTQQDQSLADTATAGPCTSLDIHPNARQFAATLTLGKGSYPDSGALVIHDWVV